MRVHDLIFRNLQLLFVPKIYEKVIKKPKILDFEIENQNFITDNFRNLFKSKNAVDEYFNVKYNICISEKYNKF